MRAPDENADGIWLIIDVERCLYVDRGVDVILCDRLDGPTTLLVRVSEEQLSKLCRETVGAIQAAGL